MCLTLSQKLKIINLSEKNMSKAKFNNKLDLLHQTVKPNCDFKGRDLERN